ncbi:MAG: response regulator [Planctomycetes bacterium]|nr:response regulator [Planctomycetota bacterium]
MAKILVVDDAVFDQRMAGACVEELGSSAIYARNGREALEVIRCENPDIVLTDLQMPEMDGLELVQQVRKKHSGVPVILMTAYGSEEVAVQALRAGAVRYVPKKTLRTHLGDALRGVLAAVEVTIQRDRVRHFLNEAESRFVLGYEPGGPQALVSYLRDGLRQLNFCDEVGLLQVCTALTEALTNAVDHGNLELDSALRETAADAYRTMGAERAQQSPYCDRRVYVTAKLTPAEATYAIRDEGPGYDPSTLPDPTDAENLLKLSGRGILLIRMFMDEIAFSETGNEITMIKRRTES